MDAALAQTSQHRAAFAVRHGGNGEDGVGQANDGHFFHRFVQRAAHGNAVEHFAALAPVVVKEALGPVAAGGILPKLRNELRARLARTENGDGHKRAAVTPQDARAVAAIKESHGQHTEHPRAGDAEEQDKGHRAHRRNAGDNLVGGKAAQRRGEQAQILLTLGVAPEAVVGFEEKLEKYRTGIKQDDVAQQSALRADLRVVKHRVDQQKKCNRGGKDHRIAEKQYFFSESIHGCPICAARPVRQPRRGIVLFYGKRTQRRRCPFFVKRGRAFARQHTNPSLLYYAF